jgi:hypothetical protein
VAGLLRESRCAPVRRRGSGPGRGRAPRSAGARRRAAGRPPAPVVVARSEPLRPSARELLVAGSTELVPAANSRNQ